jgi:hypothetical protein
MSKVEAERLSISDLVMQTREQAEEITARHKKLSSFRLYAVLAPVMEVCERAGRDPSERAQLEKLLSTQPHEGNRRFVEKGSDIYTVVCRYVFHSSGNRANLYRYAEALRQAAAIQVGSSILAHWLRHNGGINALYFRRDAVRKPARLKVLRLLETIEFPRDRPFKLTLEWTDQNAFKVHAEHSP